MKYHASVIIVNWHSEGDVVACAALLHASTPKLRLQVIVVDNATLGQHEYAALNANPHIETLIRTYVNVGFGQACNRGVAAASSDNVIFVNPDVRVGPGVVDTLLAVLETDVNVGCVGIRHNNTDGSLQWSTDSLPNPYAELFHLTPLSHVPFIQKLGRRFVRRWSDHDRDADVGWVNGACFAMRRADFQALNGFSASFFLFAEELDLCRRVHERGQLVRYVAQPAIVHSLGGSFGHGRASEYRLALLHQGMLRYFNAASERRSYAIYREGSRPIGATMLALSVLLSSVERLSGKKFPARVWSAFTCGEHGLLGGDAVLAWWRLLCIRRESTVVL